MVLCLAALSFYFSSAQSEEPALTLQNVEALAFQDLDDELPGEFVKGMSAGTRRELVLMPNGNWEVQDVPCCKSSNPHSACNMSIGPC